MVFYQEARVKFDLLWNYPAGGMSFLPICYLNDRAYEESASMEADPIGSLGTPAMITCSLKLFSQWIRQRIS
jgi:hypothetical protein